MTALNEQEIRQARIDLAASFRWAVRHGLNEGICNHFSMDVGEGRFLVNPLGLHWSEITASSLLMADFDGAVLEGDGEVEATAFYIHSRVHMACPHATVVMHTHQPYATALTLCEGGRLEPCEQKALRLCQVTAYDDDYNGVALDNDEGDRIAAQLGNKRILFMASHGIIVSHRTVAEAYDDLYYLERACQVQLLARQSGLPLRRLPEPVIDLTMQQLSGDRSSAPLHFASLKRVLDREEPDYVD
ncbi:MAG: aldolase [Alphaproteobacteria bacterium]|nr:aldolase [Alphaproteobacteria bacterium]